MFRRFWLPLLGERHQGGVLIFDGLFGLLVLIRQEFRQVIVAGHLGHCGGDEKRSLGQSVVVAVRADDFQAAKGFDFLPFLAGQAFLPFPRAGEASIEG
jgi:hypothetical protein